MGFKRIGWFLPHRPLPFCQRTSCAQVFLWTYLTLLLATTALFVTSLVDLRHQQAAQSPRAELPPVPCHVLSQLSTPTFLAAGWTKAVYQARMDIPGKTKADVAVKVVNLSGKDYVTCTKEQGLSERLCYQRSAAKILKETALLMHLIHPNIVKVLGHCGPGSLWHLDESQWRVEHENADGSHQEVVLVTELGQPLDTIRLLQMPWEDRLRVAYDVASLLEFLATSPLGSLSVNDLRRQQFVLVRGQLKLSDVDDVGVTEPLCKSDRECSVGFPPIPHGNDDVMVHVQCVRGECLGRNERHNVLSAGRQLVLPFLSVGAPEVLLPQVEQLLDCYSWLQCPAARIAQATRELVDQFARGDYRNRTEDRRISQGFEQLENHDLEGLFDYPCSKSLSSGSCVKSVADEAEARDICLKDASCRAVVMGTVTTWTGRILAFFKNGSEGPTVHEGHKLLIRTL